MRALALLLDHQLVQQHTRAQHLGIRILALLAAGTTKQERGAMMRQAGKPQEW